jgi:chromate transporter
MKEESKLGEVAKVFFKLGCFAFGGPAAHIAMMEAEVVNKRKWMSRQHYLDLIGASNLIPGPNSTEMTMHCGHERAGTKGLFVAGICFIVPAIVITGLLAFLYVEYGELPEVAPFVFGIKPAVLAIIVLGVMVLVLSLVGVNEVMALLGAGVVGAFYFYGRTKLFDQPKSIVPFALLGITGGIVSKITTVKVFLTFLKVGAVLYGSGYVLFAYLDAELVESGWMTRQALLDAIAVGQFTPGPVLSTATFIGYQLTGFWGAVAASAGIFLPSFFFVLLLNPLVPKMRKSKFLGFFLDSVNVAAVAVMAGVLYVMSVETATDWRAIAIAAISFAVVFGFKKLSVMWTVLGGACLGYLLQFV